MPSIIDIAERIKALKIDDLTKSLILDVAGILYRARGQKKIKAEELIDILKARDLRYADLDDSKLYAVLGIARDHFPLMADNRYGHYWAESQGEWDRYQERQKQSGLRKYIRCRDRQRISVDDPPPQMEMML